MIRHPHPPFGTRLDRHHPIGRKARSGFIFNEGAGGRIYNIVTERGSWPLSAAFAHSVGAEGRALRSTGNGPISIASPDLPSYTIHLRLRIEGGGEIGGGLSYPILLASGAMLFGLETSTSRLFYASGSYFDSGFGLSETVDLTLVFGGGALSLHVDGSFRQTVAFVTPSLATLSLGHSELQFKGLVYRLYVFEGGLTPQEIRGLVTDPLRILKPRRRNNWAISAGGGAEQTVSLAGIASGEALGAANVAPGPVQVAPGGIESGNAFGTVAVQPGSVGVALAGVGSAEALGAPTVLPGAASLFPAGVGSLEALGLPLVTAGGSLVAPLGIASGEALGVPHVVPGAVGVSLFGVGSAEAFGIPTASVAGSLIAPFGIVSGEAFGMPAVQPGGVNVSLSGVPSAQAFGLPRVTGGAVIDGNRTFRFRPATQRWGFGKARL